MPDIQIINSNAVFIYLMEIEQNRFSEYRKQLTENEQSKILTFGSQQKRIEFAAGRYLKTNTLGSDPMQYDATGAPYILNGPYISLTHSRHLVALGVCREHRLGIDIEEISSKSVRVSRRFVSSHEYELFDTQSDEDMTLLWSLKETMYKLSDRRELLFKEHLLVDERHENQFSVRVLHQSGFKQYTLSSFRESTFFITCNTTEAKDL